MRRTIATLTATLLLALVFAACGDDDPAPIPATDPSPAVDPETATPTAPPPTPSATATPQPSEVGDAAPAGDAPPLPDSIRELVEEVAQFRGLEAPESLVALTVARADLYDTFLELVTEEDRFELDTSTEIYRLLGYLDDTEHLWDIQTSFLNLVLGFYSPDHKTLWVVTEEAGVGLEELTRRQRETLVHEIIHALQDYHFDLDATFDSLTGNLDAELAFTSVVEGDAVVHTNRHRMRSLALPAAGGVYFLASGNQLSSIPAPVLRTLYFPYRTGASWAGSVLVNEGVEALNASLMEPPGATTLILHRELRDADWEPEQLGESTLPAEQIQESLGAGWRVRVAGSLGEFHLINYLVGDDPYVEGWLYASTSRLAVEAAKGWAGDRYTVFEHDDGGRVLVARVRFTSAEEASQFARTHTREATWQADVVEEDGFVLVKRPDGKVVGLPEPVGRDVIFAIGTSADVTRAALEPLVKG
ncbi:MAG: hypothetical protein OXH41_14180 [Chloroflexi bacterium]|nr:hypothetical protein [Chloroflexota bacterium]